ncbi:sugar ABC transporter ATP-binding protein [Brevibacillus sp. NL20B1]|jgi:simple sugar transport system ATP-binding protein|uniref:sugar ABC transporter ATP-binding protein n=1 Tax=Brevibacillus sp. NL20B1 TaxID=2829799 RepID=UPI001B9C8F58|nr:sugar ABC transporter ATP-binding protein [Brevibacillus sp. NL20B1]MBR8658679.1 sugar ABC transporter ATP-binding protein [Brevibacillus sp. NL20B1]
MTASVLEMKGIVKQYGGVYALRGVDFTVRSGEVHAILGANGAGKSTLMKILSGAEQATAGSILIDGRELAVSGPRDAKRAGIHLVQQEVDTGLIPSLSVAENILLDHTVSAGAWWHSPKRTVERAQQILSRCGFSLPLKAKAEELTLAEKQLVLLARAVAQDVRFVIFDEPTAPLSLTEAAALFELIASLKAAGLGIVYISHRLPEVFAIADRITVLRDGSRVWEKRTEQTSPEEAVAAMLGRREANQADERCRRAGEVLLEARELRIGHKVKRFDVQLRQGEIVAVVGLVGAGKTEVSRALFGADRLDGGEIRLRGKTLRLRHPGEAIQNGIALIPEERRLQGILVEEPVKHNLTLAHLKAFTRGGFLSDKAEREAAQSLVERLGIKTAGLDQPTGSLSGGNQQKVAIGKWLLTTASVFLFDEPTKGVDIGAKQEIFRLIKELADEGRGVLYFSSEIDETLALADRLIVLENGRTAAEWSRSEWTTGRITAETVMYYMSGGNHHGSSAAG